MESNQICHKKGYAPAIEALTPVLYDLPGKIVAIDGRPGAGKTTLGRYLASHFNVTLIETDLFLLGNCKFEYRNDEIARIIEYRLGMPRPVILDGVTAFQIMDALGRTADFLIYVFNSHYHKCTPCTEAELAAYDAKYAPLERADLVLKLDH